MIVIFIVIWIEDASHWIHGVHPIDWVHWYSTGALTLWWDSLHLTAQCTLCTLHCTVHCTVHNVELTEHCTWLHSAQWRKATALDCTVEKSPLHCTLHSGVHCAVHSVHCTVWNSVHCALDCTEVKSSLHCTGAQMENGFDPRTLHTPSHYLLYHSHQRFIFYHINST